MWSQRRGDGFLRRKERSQPPSPPCPRQPSGVRPCFPPPQVWGVERDGTLSIRTKAAGDVETAIGLQDQIRAHPPAPPEMPGSLFLELFLCFSHRFFLFGSKRGGR